eukprot:5272391-Amphidinium_carterae.1
MVHPHTGVAEHWLHVVDWGTGFQQSERVQSKEAAHVFMVYTRIWVRFFGHPSTLVVDAGREFLGQFSLACGHYGTLVHVIDTNSPWLNGRTERSHAELRKQVAAALDMFTPVDDDEYLAIVYHSVNMVNQHANRSGYSAIQRVLGYMPQLPNELLHESNHPALVKEGPVEAVRRSEQIRAVALEAWARVSSRQKTLAALRSRSRGPQRPFVPGERVWVWRSPGSGRAEAWYGPGTIVSLTPTGAYVSLRGSLWKVNGTCLRRQEAEDRLSDEMVGRFLHSLRTDMSREGLRTQRRYVDCTRETSPPLQSADDVALDQGRQEVRMGQEVENQVEPMPSIPEHEEHTGHPTEAIEQSQVGPAVAPMAEVEPEQAPGQ